MTMPTYSIEKLLQLWRREELTVEQVIGHLLQQRHEPTLAPLRELPNSENNDAVAGGGFPAIV